MKTTYKCIIFYGALICLVVIIVIIFILPFIFPEFLGGHSERGYRWNRTKLDIQHIASAIDQFDSEYGKLPDGDSSSVFRSILGSNPRQLVFLEVLKTNNLGDMLDFWGTPYQIEKIGGTNVLVKSAGQNQKWGDKDDFVFDGHKREFIQDPSPGTH